MAFLCAQPRTGRLTLPILFASVCVLLAVGAGTARAQLLHLDPMLWTAATDSLTGPSLEIELSRFEEPKFGWSADRVLLTLRLPTSPEGGFFVRMPHATFDFGDTSLFARWPWLRSGEEIDESWSERRVVSFAQLEVGGDRRASWPWLGDFAYGGAIGLPVGSDRLYPLSSVSFPIRAEVRKRLVAGDRIDLAADAGLLYNIASRSDELDGDIAFPGGWHARAVLRLGPERGRQMVLDVDHQDRDGRLSQRLGAALTLPWTDRGSFTARIDRELAGTLDRFAAWRFAVAWRFEHRALELLPDAGADELDEDGTEESPPAGATDSQVGTPKPPAPGGG